MPVTSSDTVSLVCVSLPLKLKEIQNIPSLSDSLALQTSQQTYMCGHNSHRLANQPQAQPDWLTEQQAHSSTVVVSMLAMKLHSGYTRSELKNWQWYWTIRWISAGYIIHNITSSADIVSVTALPLHFTLTSCWLSYNYKHRKWAGWKLKFWPPSF